MEATKEETRFSLHQLGILEPLERLQDFVPSDTVDKSIPGHEQQHRLEHLRHHLKESALLAEQLFGERSCTGVDLMAETRVMALLEEYVPEALKSKIAGIIADSPDADTRNRNHAVDARSDGTKTRSSPRV